MLDKSEYMTDTEQIYLMDQMLSQVYKLKEDLSDASQFLLKKNIVFRMKEVNENDE